MKIEDEINSNKFPNAKIKAIINIIFTASWANRQHNQLLKQFDLSVQQYNILRILRGANPSPLPVLTIKNRMVEKTPNTTRLIDKLLRKNLVKRFRCDTDRRIVFVQITEEGLGLIDEIEPIFIDNDQIMNNLSSEECETISNLLDKLRG